MSLSAGQRLGPYEITVPLGAGAMGEVYRARDTRLGRDVAIKVLPTSLSAEPDRLRRFEQEARSAGVLNHPNVLAIHDIGSHEGAPYLVSELLEGQSLRQRMGGSSLPVRKALDWAIQIAHGLAAAHEKGIVHRDLKPDNLFVTNDGRVKILDFGLAKLTAPEPEEPSAKTDPTAVETVAAHTDPGTVLGTAGYMSPEQVRGKAVDQRSDIFSFGAILYEMLSGQRAFRGDTAADTMSAILKEEPPELSMVGRNIPPGVERIVRHCMEKSPKQRFQSTRDLAFNLEAITSDSGEGPALTSAPRARSWGLPLRMTGVVLLAAAIGLAIGLFLGKRTAKPSLPEYHRMTFRHGTIESARFGPDGETLVYSAAWEGNPERLFMKRPESPDAPPLDLPPHVRLLGVSSTGEVAILLGGYERFGNIGTLARVPLTGGTPREIAERVQAADWAPDGTGLALVRSLGGLQRLEFPPGNTLYETTGYIDDPRFSPRGDLVAFLDHPLPNDDRGSVVVTDLFGDVKRLSTGWESINGLAWSPSGDEIWFTGAETGFFRELYGVTLGGRLRMIALAPGGLVLHDVSAGGRVLLTREDRRLGILALAPGESQERDLSWLEASLAVDLSADGEYLLFHEGGEATGSDYAVCLRKTDGSPPVRLGNGGAFSLSPDGKWALSQLPTPDAPLVFLPIGPGEPRSLQFEEISVLRARWFPDGMRLLVAGFEEGHGPRLYVSNLEGEDPRPVTPEGVAGHSGELSGECISPDGRWVTAMGPEQTAWLHPLADGEPHPVTGAEAGDFPVRWTSDGRSLFVARYHQSFTDIFRLDLETGQRTFWKKLQPRDPAGVTAIVGALMTPDGESYAYTYVRALSELYVVEGLK